MASRNPVVFTVFKNEKEGRDTILSMRPKLGKFGVKSITVELNDGSVIDLDDKSCFFLNDPRESITFNMNNGKLSEEAGTERISKLDSACISKDVVLKL